MDRYTTLTGLWWDRLPALVKFELHDISPGDTTSQSCRLQLQDCERATRRAALRLVPIGTPIHAYKSLNRQNSRYSTMIGSGNSSFCGPTNR